MGSRSRCSTCGNRGLCPPRADLGTRTPPHRTNQDILKALFHLADVVFKEFDLGPSTARDHLEGERPTEVLVADTFRTFDTAFHGRGDRFSIPDRVCAQLGLAQPRAGAPVGRIQFLEVTFPPLVTDRAIQGMVPQDHFQDVFLDFFHPQMVEGDREVRGHQKGTTGDRLEGLGDLDQTHPTVSTEGEFGMVTKVGDQGRKDPLDKGENTYLFKGVHQFNLVDEKDADFHRDI